MTIYFKKTELWLSPNLPKGDSYFILQICFSRLSLYYFNARWYDPATGRFISEDPILDGLNWYLYCLNNPLLYTDPNGLEVFIGLNTLSNYRINGKPLGAPGTLFVHSSIIITDNKGNVLEYIESGMKSDGTTNWNTKIEDGSYSKQRFKDAGITPSNKAGEWEGQFDVTVQLMPVPEGMTQEQFEQAIRDVANT